jgi:predicted small secreted protein
MKKIVGLLPALLLASLLINSCASASKASEDRSQAAKQFEKHPEKGVVYLYRH